MLNEETWSAYGLLYVSIIGLNLIIIFLLKKIRNCRSEMGSNYAVFCLAVELECLLFLASNCGMVTNLK